MANTTVGTQTRLSIGLSDVAASSVTTYSFQQTVPGTSFTVTNRVTDGTDGNDIIAGDPTGQHVFGFGGNDTISNSGSAAILVGGTGADVFKMYNNSSLAGISDGNILDFEAGSDRIDVSHLNIGSLDDLVITSNSNGTNATIENAATTFKIIVSSLSGLNSLSASSFIFNDNATGGEDTVTETNTPTTGNDSLLGADTDDSINAAAGDDTVIGGLGNDTLIGGQGNDDVRGGAGNDDVRGSAGADTIRGGAGNDVLKGGEGDDQLFGGTDIDELVGGAGNDVLKGGAGGDDLSGGQGDDIFVFAGTSFGADTVNGFTSGEDLLQFNSEAFTTAQDVLSATTYSTDGATITLSAGNTVVVAGVAENSLTADDFVIV